MATTYDIPDDRCVEIRGMQYPSHEALWDLIYTRYPITITDPQAERWWTLTRQEPVALRHLSRYLSYAEHEQGAPIDLWLDEHADMCSTLAYAMVASLALRWFDEISTEWCNDSIEDIMKLHPRAQKWMIIGSRAFNRRVKRAEESIQTQLHTFTIL